MPTDLVTRFCTPPELPITDTDARALASSKPFSIDFEGGEIQCYAWGDGPNVVLPHGWGSRASHMALVARHLASRGFRSVSYDAPAHSSVEDRAGATSNMFEHCRALSAVAAAVGEVYAVVGHSMGGAAAAFTVAGSERLAEYRFSASKLVLLSAPASVDSVIRAFANRNKLNLTERVFLRSGLEADFEMSVEFFSVGAALRSLDGVDVMMVHDRSDEEFPIDDALATCRDAGPLQLFLTDGLGHARSLTSRVVMREIDRFLSR